jgi:hypothetical protein
LIESEGNDMTSTARATGNDNSSNSYNDHNEEEYGCGLIALEPPVKKLLADALNNQRKQNRHDSSTPFRALRKREQNAMIMAMLTKINYQILKFNVKKLFQIWALYHPEDTNCAIIAQIMFKKSANQDINTIRKELQAKNRKSKKGYPKNMGANYAKYEQKISGGLYATLQVRPPSSCGGGGGNNTGEQDRERSRPTVLAYGSPELKLRLFRALDNRGLLQCAKFFSTTVYKIRDLPLIMCYTDYHIDQLIDVCRRSKQFPLHLLPVYLRKDAQNLLRM